MNWNELYRKVRKLCSDYIGTDDLDLFVDFSYKRLYDLLLCLQKFNSLQAARLAEKEL